MKNYTEIEGWSDHHDYAFFRSLILTNSNFSNSDDVFVEVGSFKGRSSAAISDLIAESGKDILFVCVDTWNGSEEHQKGERHEDQDVVNNVLYDKFLDNVGGRIKNIRPLRMTSLEASKLFSKDLACVFLDAAHDYDNVMADITAWIPKIKPNGILCGHDYTWPKNKTIKARY